MAGMENGPGRTAAMEKNSERRLVADSVEKLAMNAPSC
jgi:hypothetical protein